MLRGKFIDDEIISLYKNGQVTPASLQVSLGVNCDLSDQPHSIKMNIPCLAGIDGIENTNVILKHYCYDKTMCLPGKSVITSLIYTKYEYWDKLGANSEAYNTEKQRVAEKLIESIQTRFPAVKGRIEVVDVATPLTYNRYMDVWKGAYCGWIKPVNKIPSTLPGLRCFYMAGQWTRPCRWSSYGFNFRKAKRDGTMQGGW